MSRKTVANRLESLFLDLEVSQKPEEEESLQPISSLPLEPQAQNGWTWSVGADGTYEFISSEIKDSLGLAPDVFLGQKFTEYRLAPQDVEKLAEVIQNGLFPVAVTVHIENISSHWLPIQIEIVNGDPANGFHGYCQVVAEPPIPTIPLPTPPDPPDVQALSTSEPYRLRADPNQPVRLMRSVPLRNRDPYLLEITDKRRALDWTEDERRLVEDVITGLTQALENADLYRTVQTELTERIRAEQVILRRNRDLATLNQVGQQLSRLNSQTEIFALLKELTTQVTGCQTVYIKAVNTVTPRESEDSAPASEDALRQRLVQKLAHYVLKNQKPLLAVRNTSDFLKQINVQVEGTPPASLLIVPIVPTQGDAVILAAIEPDREEAFDQSHIELLSTATAQAITALENATLFSGMQQALQALENRERYQANTARAVASLTENGLRAINEVLELLAAASKSNRIYIATPRQDAKGWHWETLVSWTDPSLSYRLDDSRLKHMPLVPSTEWLARIQEDGQYICSAHEDHPFKHAYTSQDFHASLFLALSSRLAYPSILVFDLFENNSIWTTEEINVLRVAADAIVNTYVREDLLNQVQESLEESEALYRASSNLALATDLQAMLASVITEINPRSLNRAILLTFDLDSFSKVSRISVGANWYSGYGQPPSPIGTEYPRLVFEQLLLTQTPLFYQDLAPLPNDTVREILQERKTRSLAVLPLWSAKRQIGAILLESQEIRDFTKREQRSYPPLADQIAVSVENLRLFEQTQLSLQETELLFRMSNGIAQAATPQDMLDTLLNNALPDDIDQTWIVSVSTNPIGELETIEFEAGFDANSQALTNLGKVIPAASLPLLRSLRDEAIVWTDLFQSQFDEQSIRTLDSLGAQAGFLIPLRSSGRLSGIILVASHTAREFSASQSRLMRIIGSSVAVAFEKQRLLRQAQRRALELQAAAEIARDTASTLSQEMLLTRIVELLSIRFDFYQVSIFLLDEPRKYASVAASHGPASEELLRRKHRLAVGSRSVVGSVVTNGQPFILNDVAQSDSHYNNPLLPETRAEMGLPLKIGNRIIGALDVQSKFTNAFPEDEISVYEILADQIAVAIENARAYEISQQAVEDMREVDRVKSQFLANMSHELRTPLNSIIGFSRVILKGIDGPINETQEQDLSAIYNSGQHLLSLINNILDLSKIEAGKMELSFADIALPDLIHSVMSTAVGLVKDKPVKLVQNIADDIPIIQADATRIRQVLLNLVSNAAKFTDEGIITVSANQQIGLNGQPEIIITVKDTGPGIAVADQEKLFLPFSQVDDSATRKTGGTGLGLSICLSLIEMHGGRIGLMESVVGEGSTFFFTLPMKAPPAPPQPTNELSQLGGASENRLILTIDDDPRVLQLYDRYLTSNGYRVAPLTTSRLAVQKAVELQPFAITLDVMMPDMDGWQVLHALKNDERTRHIPVILCSILKEEEKGVHLGAADYLVKPFLEDELIQVVSRLGSAEEQFRILVIDDDPDDLRLVTKVLENNSHFEILTASGGQEGWYSILGNQPDAIILDLFMPEINGFTLLEWLKGDPRLGQIPVIVLTGADLTPEQLYLLNRFGQDLLTKGALSEEDLLKSLTDSLSRLKD